MFSLLALFAHVLRPIPAAQAHNPASALMEGADARAGHDPQSAHQMRDAARAWLRVVR